MGSKGKKDIVRERKCQQIIFYDRNLWGILSEKQNPPNDRFDWKKGNLKRWGNVKMTKSVW